MTSEEYREKLKAVKLAMGELTDAVIRDLQRLESAETENTKMKVKNAYEQGIIEAFEVCEKLTFICSWGGYTTGDYQAIFGDDFQSGAAIMRDNDPLEVVEKVKAYESRKKAEEREKGLEVGDVVKIKGHMQPVVVMDVYDLVFEGYDGLTYQRYEKDYAEKTGKKIELVKALKTELAGLCK